MPQHPHLRDLCHDAFAIFPHDQIGEQRSLLPRSPTDATVAVGDRAESAFLYRTELRLRDEEPEVDPRRDRLQDLRI